jgi:NAD(P)-dependent dehydrogenase (short-subunit alcohol dehydrogenase family)
MSQTMRLHERIILITGSTTGIGAAMARRFVVEGARVVLHGRDAARGESLRRELGTDRAAFLTGDLADERCPAELAAAAAACFGGLDALVNNAALTARADVDDTDTAFFDRMIAVNLRSVFLCMKHEIPHMLAEGGSVVNTASGAGLVAYPGQAPYVSSKHGVIGLTKTAALEYGRQGVRVNAVCPGTVLTPMVEKVIARGLEPALIALHPIGRIGTADEVANAVLWLCSDDASFVIGHSLSVDGGYVVP